MEPVRRQEDAVRQGRCVTELLTIKCCVREQALSQWTCLDCESVCRQKEWKPCCWGHLKRMAALCPSAMCCEFLGLCSGTLGLWRAVQGVSSWKVCPACCREGGADVLALFWVLSEQHANTKCWWLLTHCAKNYGGWWHWLLILTRFNCKNEIILCKGLYWIKKAAGTFWAFPKPSAAIVPGWVP